MNLDNLHKVMKGDMTIDQACEGMTDDFEIGHVSHRADGDYRKVAQGKWVPVKAGGGQQKPQGGDKEAGNAPQFKMGDKVRIKKEFLNPGESQREYSIANINAGTGRAYVQAEGTGMKLAPQELVGMNMLERVPENEPAEQQGGGTNPAYKTFEEKYAEATFGKNEAEKMGWKMADVGAYPFWDSPDGKYRISAQHTAKEGGFEYELRDKDTGRTIGRYPTLLGALRQKDYETTDAPPRLTRDTKIRLSRIKR